MRKKNKAILIDNDIKNHPRNSKARAVLNPFQKHLGKLNLSDSNILIGATAEKKVVRRIYEIYPEAKILYNYYVESGFYYDSLKLYNIFQVDLIVITDRALIVVEVKHISGDVKLILANSGDPKWKIICSNNDLKKTCDINGITQNSYHTRLIKDILEYENIKIPIYSLTVIDGPNITNDKIYACCYRNEMVCSFDNLEETLKEIHVLAGLKEVTLNQCIFELLESYRCRREGIERLHIFLLRRRNCRRGGKPLKLLSKCAGEVCMDNPYAHEKKILL